MIQQEVKIYKDDAIKDGLNDAKGEVKKYITELTDAGILVHEETDSEHPVIDEDTGEFTVNANGVHISDDVDIIRQGECVASYGEFVVIGKDGEATLYQDYHSLEFRDKNGLSYFHISDLVDRDGFINYQFVGDGVKDSYRFPFNPIQVTVKIDDVVTTDYDIVSYNPPGPVSRIAYVLNFDTPPSVGSVVKIKYSTGVTNTKSYTFGVRDEGSIIGGYSVCEGYGNKASGAYSHAEGHNTEASGLESHAGGVGTVANIDSQTVIGRYNKGDTSKKSLFVVGGGTDEFHKEDLFKVNRTYDSTNNVIGGNVESIGDFYTHNNYLELGAYEAMGHLTNSLTMLAFSIPLGRVYPPGTTITRLEADIVARSANSSGAGVYVMKSSSGGTSVVHVNSSTSSSTFYNGGNHATALNDTYWTLSLHGGTNVYVRIQGPADSYYFADNTFMSTLNNQPVAVSLSNLIIVLNVPVI